MIPNPRSRKRRGDPIWMLYAVNMMKFVNITTIWLIVLLIIWIEMQ